MDAASLAQVKQRATEEINKAGGIPKGACVPRISPGLKFWGGGDSQTVCGQANAICPVTFEKKLIGSEKCVKNCECLEKETEMKRAQLCMAMGDCGPKVNIVGEAGSGAGYKVTKEELKKK